MYSLIHPSTFNIFQPYQRSAEPIANGLRIMISSTSSKTRRVVCGWIVYPHSSRQASSVHPALVFLLCFPVKSALSEPFKLSRLSMLQCRKSWAGRNLTKTLGSCGSKMYKEVQNNVTFCHFLSESWPRWCQWPCPGHGQHALLKKGKRHGLANRNRTHWGLSGCTRRFCELEGKGLTPRPVVSPSATGAVDFFSSKQRNLG